MNIKNIQEGLIDGIKLFKINNYSNDTGSLSVLISQGREDAPDATKIGEVYMVSVPSKNTTRGSHRHDFSDEFFIIINGLAEFYLFDDREKSKTKGKKERYILDSNEMSALFVPRGIYHAFVTLEPDTNCLAISTEPFDKNKPDTHQISFSNFL
jgi:dTDP-4-dehydrorhamnose 3,5-epimerase-like enzyme